MSIDIAENKYPVVQRRPQQWIFWVGLNPPLFRVPRSVAFEMIGGALAMLREVKEFGPGHRVRLAFREPPQIGG